MHGLKSKSDVVQGSSSLTSTGFALHRDCLVQITLLVNQTLLLNPCNVFFEK